MKCGGCRKSQISDLPCQLYGQGIFKIWKLVYNLMGGLELDLCLCAAFCAEQAQRKGIYAK